MVEFSFYYAYNIKKEILEGGYMSRVKTNAMRILDSHNIEYNIITYDKRDGNIDGPSVARKINRKPEEVFKTLVTKGSSGQLYVFIIPVNEELDLKKAARATEEKRIEMLAAKDITKYTGYVRGGCSPIGMKRHYPTFIHESVVYLNTLIVSGGKIGIQIELKLKDLQLITGAKICKLIK